MQWISGQINWLAKYLGVKGTPDERLKIWPIAQLSDWGEKVSAKQVASILDYATPHPQREYLSFDGERFTRKRTK